MGSPTIDAFAQSLPGKRVLNLGSGSGRDALLLRDQGLDVLCVDASHRMIALTEKLGFTSQLADFASVDFAPHSFGGVWAYTSLIHVDRKTAMKVMQRIHTWLVPGGRFLLGVIEGQGTTHVKRDNMPHARRLFALYKRDELKDLIEPLGFELLRQDDYRPSRKNYLAQLYQKKPA